jgi:hypothetical protein
MEEDPVLEHVVGLMFSITHQVELVGSSFFMLFLLLFLFFFLYLFLYLLDLRRFFLSGRTPSGIGVV